MTAECHLILMQSLVQESQDIRKKCFLASPKIIEQNMIKTWLLHIPINEDNKIWHFIYIAPRVISSDRLSQTPPSFHSATHRLQTGFSCPQSCHWFKRNLKVEMLRGAWDRKAGREYHKRGRRSVKARHSSQRKYGPNTTLTLNYDHWENLVWDPFNPELEWCHWKRTMKMNEVRIRVGNRTSSRVSSTSDGQKNVDRWERRVRAWGSRVAGMRGHETSSDRGLHKLYH